MGKQRSVFRSRRRKRGTAPPYSPTSHQHRSPKNLFGKSQSTRNGYQDEKEWSFQEYGKNLSPPARIQSENVCLFLYQREISGMIPHPTRRRPRKRTIPFSKLQTGATEAVVGIEGTGSFFVSFDQGSHESSSINLRFYAVPSQMAVMQQEQQQQQERNHQIPISIRLQTISIPAKPSPNIATTNFHFAGIGDSSALTTKSLEVLFSSDDWSIGVALVCPLSNHTPPAPWQNHDSGSDTHDDDESPLGSLFLFSSNLSKHGASDCCWPSHKCVNVRVRPQNTMRKLLWRVHSIPTIHHSNTNQPTAADDHHWSPESFASSSNWMIHDVPGYLFLNDEDDGFRLTWISLPCFWTARTCPPDHQFLDMTGYSWGITPIRDDIVAVLREQTWEPANPRKPPPPTSQNSSEKNDKDLRVELEAYLRVDALLDDIRQRRREMFHYDQPADFSYELISVTHDGRYVSLAVVFSNNRTTLSVIVTVDLYTQHYREVQWGRCKLTPEPSTLQRWSRLLALNRRLLELRLGPFCVADTTLHNNHHDWSSFVVEDNSTRWEGDNRNDPLWTSFLLHTSSSSMTASPSTPSSTGSRGISVKGPSHVKPKTISFATLYPDCDLVTNNAIRGGRPVRLISCRSGTTEFVYG